MRVDITYSMRFRPPTVGVSARSSAALTVSAGGSGSQRAARGLRTPRADHAVHAMTAHPAVTNDVPMRGSETQATGIRVDTAGIALRCAGDQHPARRLGHRPVLDGVRGVAVLLVIAVRVALLDSADIGVDVFFPLSGLDHRAPVRGVGASRCALTAWLLREPRAPAAAGAGQCWWWTSFPCAAQLRAGRGRVRGIRGQRDSAVRRPRPPVGR